MGGGQCSTFYAQGLAPREPAAAADAVAAEAHGWPALAAGVRAFGSGNASCERTPRPWFANRLPMNQPAVVHEWSRPGPRGFRGAFKGTYGNGSFFSVAWAPTAGGYAYTCSVATAERYPWLMLYFGADAARGLKGGVFYDGRGMLDLSSSAAIVRFRLAVHHVEPRDAMSFYLLNLGACWKIDGLPCDGDTRTDMTRYALFDLTGPGLCAPGRGQRNCPGAHTFANGTTCFRNETQRFPYAAYKYYCWGASCDHFSNPALQEIIKLAPHAEWAPHGAPASADLGRAPQRYAIDAGALLARLHFAGPEARAGQPGAPPGQRWTTLNIGAEVGIPGQSRAGRATATWTVSELDVSTGDGAGGGPEGGPIGRAGLQPQHHLAEGRGVQGAVAVDVSSTVAGVTGDPFVCVTLDWWPRNKCDYGTCPWAGAGVGEELRLRDGRLVAALRQLSAVMVRVGGSCQDNITYTGFTPDTSADGTTRAAGPESAACPTPMRPAPHERASAFTGGCLHRSRWDDLVHLAKAGGAVLAFGLNSVIGRQALHDDGDDGGDGGWDPLGQTEALLHYSARRKDPVVAWELGNEPGHMPPSSLVFCRPPGHMGCAFTSKGAFVASHAAALRRLDALVTDAYGARGTKGRPAVVAPDVASMDAQAAREYARLTGGALDVYSFHWYPLGPGAGREGLEERMLHPNVSAYRAASASAVQAVDLSGAAGVWVGETGGAYNSGGPGLSNAFADVFWWVTFLGASAAGGAKAVCRQALIGGHYGLLQGARRLQPTPAFFATALFSRLAGRRVLTTSVTTAAQSSGPSEATRVAAFAHCAKAGPGVVVIFTNPTDAPVAVHLRGAVAGAELQPREEYVLTPAGPASPAPGPRSLGAALNGRLLSLQSRLEPRPVAGGGVTLAPWSVTYAVFPKADAGGVCHRDTPPGPPPCAW